jgi:ABC-type glycerol-3-phosphate transport system permease component
MAQAGRTTAETVSLAVPKEASLRPDAFLKHAVLLFAVFIALVPTIYMIMTALKSDDEYTFNKIGFPHALVLDHFDIVLFQSPFFQWMGNSAILAGGPVLLSTAVSCLGSYAIARMQFRGRQLLFSISVALMAIPPVVMIVPLFVLYSRLGMISTYEGAILIYAGLITPFSVYLLTTFFRTLPKELFEAARMDGAGDFLILWRIVLPLSLPALLTLVVVNALYVWNDLLIAIIFLQDDSKRTLMAGISVFQGRYENQIPLVMAGMVIASAPMIILYIAFQKYFIRGLMAGAVK